MLHSNNHSGRRSPNLVGKLIQGVISAGAGWIAYSHFAINHDVELPEALAAERASFYTAQAGKVSYYVDRQAQGKPLVLVHSVNAAASAFEMRPLFEHFRTRRPVYAIDLPGFGFSERTDREYSPQMYAGTLQSFLSGQVGEPADVVALSLGSEFAARAALAEPGLLRSLAMISPSGFSDRDRANQEADQEEPKSHAPYAVLAFPLWKQALYDLLATPASIRYYLKKSFVGDVPGEMSAYADAASHQPGAANAPLYFVSGLLFTPGVRRRIYAKLDRPALVIYDEDPYVSFERLPEHTLKHPNWRAVRIAPTRGLPQFEKSGETIQALESFWSAL